MTIVQDKPEIIKGRDTEVTRNGHTLCRRNEPDQSEFADIPILTNPPPLKLTVLYDTSDNTVSNFDDEDFSHIDATDLDQNESVTLQKVKNETVSLEEKVFNTSLDLSDFEEDDLQRQTNCFSASLENEHSQTLRDKQLLSPGCVMTSRTIAVDDYSPCLNEQHNFLNVNDKYDIYSDDNCRGESKDEGKFLETKLDSGLGDSIKIISINFNSATLLQSNESESHYTLEIIFKDAPIKRENENLLCDESHKVSTPEEEKAALFSSVSVYKWPYTTVTLCSNPENETKWKLCQRRTSVVNDSSHEYKSILSVEKFINEQRATPLCDFVLKIRHAGDRDGKTSDSMECNPDLSAMTSKTFDIPLFEGSIKTVPIVLLHWVNGSAIRLLCPVEYIVLPASLKAYFNMVKESSLTREETMAFEWIRYATFNSFPRSINISTTRLAKSGFYATGTGAQVKCFCCNVMNDLWSSEEDPNEVHRRISPNCQFLAGESHYPHNMSIHQQDEEHISHVNENSSLPLEAQHTSSIARINPSSDQASSSAATGSADADCQESSPRSTTAPQAFAIIEKNQTSDGNHLHIQQNTAGGYYSNDNQSLQNSAALPMHIDDSRITHRSRQEAHERTVSALESAPLSIAQQPTDDAHNNDYSNTGNFFRRSGDTRERNVQGNQSMSPSGGPFRTTECPKYLNYQILEKRIQSFASWPLHLDQTPEQLAEAGFFHMGVQDYVRCFHCGGGLRNFEPGDNPWIEHARWYPQCAYVRAKKGQRFVDAVEMKHQALLAQQSNQNAADSSLNQSASSQTRISPGSSRINVGSSGKQTSLNANANERMNALSGQTDKNQLMHPNVAKLSDPVSLAYSVLCNTPRPLNGNVNNNNSQQEAYKVPEASLMPACDQQLVVEEHARLTNRSKCKVCKQRESVIVFLPCGHLAACETCAPTENDCPVCRKKILASVRTYR